MSGRLPSLQKVTVSIPQEVVEFMEAVWCMIEYHDERVEQVSDDGIQEPYIAPIVGCVNDLKAKYFSFLYTICKDPFIYWHLDLFDNEIEDIAKRHTTKLSLWKCVKCNSHDLFTNQGHFYCKCTGGNAIGKW